MQFNYLNCLQNLVQETKKLSRLFTHIFSLGLSNYNTMFFPQLLILYIYSYAYNYIQHLMKLPYDVDCDITIILT